MEKFDKYKSKVNWGEGAENLEPIPKIIWSFWDTHSDSELVDLCITQFKKLVPDFELIILNTKNVKNYLPDILPVRKDLPFVNYTDLVRLEILKKNGGIWIDISTILTENLSWVYDLKENLKYDLLGFYSDFCTTDMQNPILESWFLATPKNNKFVSAWHQEFFACYTSPQPYEFFKEIKNNKDEIQNIGDLADYLIIYLAAISVMKKNKDFRISMISANEVGHYFSFRLKSSYQQLADIFLKKASPNHVPTLIKFTGNQRNYLDREIFLGRYHRNAFLFSITGGAFPYHKIVKHEINYIKFILRNLKNKYLK